MLAIHPSQIPESGLHLAGEFDHDIFGLPEKDEAQPVAPVRYDLQVRHMHSIVFVTGTLYAIFRVPCVNCLESFECHLVIPEWEADFPVEEVEGGVIDLEESIREDLLFELPTHPRCEDYVKDRACPGRRTASFESTGNGESVWDALDSLEDSGR